MGREWHRKLGDLAVLSCHIPTCSMHGLGAGAGIGYLLSLSLRWLQRQACWWSLPFTGSSTLETTQERALASRFKDSASFRKGGISRIQCLGKCLAHTIAFYSHYNRYYNHCSINISWIPNLLSVISCITFTCSLYRKKRSMVPKMNTALSGRKKWQKYVTQMKH